MNGENNAFSSRFLQRKESAERQTLKHFMTFGN